MRDRVAQSIAAIIRDTTNPSTALADAEALARSSAVRDYLPRARANDHEMNCSRVHGAGHGLAGIVGGATILELRVRDDATELCRVSPIAKLDDQITFALAGVPAEVKFYAPAIHRYANGTYDFFVARLLIDLRNEGNAWPVLTYENAAKRAVRFVAAHWQSIQNVALALASTDDLPDDEVRLFARCGYDR